MQAMIVEVIMGIGLGLTVEGGALITLKSYTIEDGHQIAASSSRIAISETEIRGPVTIEERGMWNGQGEIATLGATRGQGNLQITMGLKPHATREVNLQ